MANNITLARYKRLLAAADAAAKKAEAARVELAQNCTHPREFIATYRWEHDNGYGRQSMHTGNMCRICRWRDPWRDGKFHDPETLTGDA